MTNTLNKTRISSRNSFQTGCPIWLLTRNRVVTKKHYREISYLSMDKRDITDEFWVKLKPLPSGRKKSWRERAHDNKRIKNAVFEVLRTVLSWQDLPYE